MGGDRRRRPRLPFTYCPMPATTTTPRARLPRTLAGLSSHPWVESVSDERGMGAGIWVYLKPGYVSHDCCHTIHESTVRECCRAFRFVWHDPEDYLLEEQATRKYLADLADLATPAPAEAAPVAPASARPCDGDTAPAPRPVLPGEATPPPAPSHGDRAPRLPELCPATPGTPTRAEAVRDVERRDGGGVAVICSGSDREAFRLPDTVSHCGAAAALEAAGWILSPDLEALAQRWRDISGEQPPSAEAVAIAEAAAPQGRRFEVFHRTWWQAPGVPGVGQSHHVGWAQTEARARYLCRRWNASHPAGPLSDRAEYTTA